MNDDLIIRAEGLGKKYLIGHQATDRGTTLREAFTRSVKNFSRSAQDMLRGKPIISGDEVEEFWALNDVSFEIKRGDIVGIIGRNGAGKSTLLKVLSRITEPSSGRVEIRGRVASLLEVGTGFHQELSGRENIFLNGAILGMSRTEIRRKFDEIVEFSEVENFLDTPVKRYSSGMYVRLAFAVAAHLEPEILVVDEVLAVGDAAFRKKCLGKMRDVTGQGRTVLFVSHDMGSVASVCSSGMLLEHGRVVDRGEIQGVLNTYLHRGTTDATHLRRSFEGPLKMVEISDLLVNGQGSAQSTTVSSKDEIEIELRGIVSEPIRDFQFACALHFEGARIMTLTDSASPLDKGPFRARFFIPKETLRPGPFSIAAGGKRVSGNEWIWGTDLAILEIVPSWTEDYRQQDIGVFNSRLPT